MKFKQTHLALTIATLLGTSALPTPASAGVGLADGVYDMVINNTPYSGGGGYQFGSDGAWNSSFTWSAVPGIFSQAMYDDTIAQPANGIYAGAINDGVSGTFRILVQGGAITGLGPFEFDTISNGPWGDHVEYSSSASWTGSVDTLGNMTLTPTGTLATFGDFEEIVDERWNVDNYNGFGGSTPNPPNGNTAWDTFSTGSATNSAGTINGAAYDGNTAILVKGGSLGSDFGGLFGAQYLEVWNVSFNLILQTPGTGSITTWWADGTTNWVLLSSDPDPQTGWIRVNEQYYGSGLKKPALMEPIIIAAKAHNYADLAMTLSPYLGLWQMDDISLENQINPGTPGTVSTMETVDFQPNVSGWGPLFVSVPEPTLNGDYGFYPTNSAQAAIAAEALMTGAQITFEEGCNGSICGPLLWLQLE